MTTNDAERRVLDGSVWDDFCDALKAAGKVVQSEKAPTDAFTKAEGYRYLARLLRAGLESFVEHGDPAFPELRCPAHTTIKMGADNPDNYYQNASIDPGYDYRITGTRGTVDYLGFGTVINRYATGGGMKTTGWLDSRQIDIAADGSFEIIVSKTERPGNWLPMGTETNSINIRQTFQDRANEQRAEIEITRIGSETERPAPFSPERLERGLAGTAMFLHGTSQLFEDWSESFLPTINEMTPADQAYCQSIGGDPNIYYFHSAWELADDEVLVLEAKTIPECQTWNFQLDNWWMESLDYRYHTIHINKHTAHYENDGSVRVIVSHTDPGLPNWIETAGHSCGTMCWRWIGADEHPPVATRVMKLSELV
jgi:hypothetical protein